MSDHFPLKLLSGTKLEGQFKEGQPDIRQNRASISQTKNENNGIDATVCVLSVLTP